MNTLKKISLLLISLLTVPGIGYAQFEDDLLKFFQAGQEDGTKLLTAYLNPAVTGFSYGLNGAWFHTARPHKTAGFDINIAITPVFIPRSRDTFDPMSLELNTVVGFRNTTNPESNAPTMLGPADNTRYYVNYDLNNNGVVNTPSNPYADAGDTFGGPEGLDLRSRIKVAPVGSPMVQVGVGLFKGTDIMLRFTPKINIGPTRTQLYGVGLRHDIKQHFNSLKMLPFDLSLMAGYTRLSININLSEASSIFPPANAGSVQESTYATDAFLASALISKNIGIFTLFGGAGYNSISTRTRINGSYTFFSNTPSAFTLTDPFAATFTNSSFRIDAGFRLNLLAFFIYSNYTFQEYSAVTAGLGFTFR